MNFVSYPTKTEIPAAIIGESRKDNIVLFSSMKIF